jgi:hypothetical protein
MEMLIFLLIALVLFAFASMRWGFDSRDGINSPEWERRQH